MVQNEVGDDTTGQGVSETDRNVSTLDYPGVAPSKVYGERRTGPRKDCVHSLETPLDVRSHLQVPNCGRHTDRDRSPLSSLPIYEGAE